MLNQLLNIYQLQLVVGLDIVKLGESRQIIVSKLGEPDSSEDREYHKTDFYHTREISLEYSYNALKCVSIEIFPHAKVMYGGVDLLSLKYDEALRWIRSLDSNIEEDDDYYGDGFTAHDTQISMGTKLYKEGAIESLMVFSADYWPSAEEREAASQKRVQEIMSRTTEEEAEARLEARMNRVSGPESFR